MRLLPLITVLALAAVPATAQQSGSQQPSAKGTQATGQPDRMTAMSQQKLRQTLQQAGFKDIRIVDAAYVVHAQTKDGDMVVMYIDPPSGTTGSGQDRSTNSPRTGKQQSK